MFKLYGYPNTRSFRILWMLEECGVDYDYVPTNPANALDNPEFVKLNPSGKIPVLRQGDFVLTESAAILNYLADQHAGKALAPPPGTQERAIYDQWCFFSMAELEQPLWALVKHDFILPEALRIAAIKDTAVWEFEQAANILAKRLNTSSYIAYDHFSAADILISTTLAWSESLKITSPHGVFKSYSKTLSSRPAFQRAMEKDVV